jgi:hypothetical protein
MSVPANLVYTQGTGAPAITADNLNTFVQTIQTLAQARGFTGTANQQIFLQGFASADDGGQGNFYWNTTTGSDDGGVTTIVPTGSVAGCWSRLFNNSPTFGVTTNSNAAAGYVGEYVAGSIGVTTPVALTSAVSANITSISLTAGDWDIDGVCQFSGGTSTVVQYLNASISLISATQDLSPDRLTSFGYTTVTLFNDTIPVTVRTGTARLSLANTTTVFLVANAGFTVSSCNSYGLLRARRVR